MKKVNTLRFGEIDIDEGKIVHFEDGIPAFEEEHEFVIIPYDDESPYVFLQSLSTPDLAFLMTMPFVFFPEYEFELDDESQAKLGIEEQEEMLIYSLLTIPGGKVSEMTANLMAPVVVNTTNMQARQLVLDKSRYTTKHRLFPETKEDK
ncbi:flagellar assembly factor FliW [Selenomonas sp. WCT3]|uniref:flagellar assembly protein FliW n=1 Tax=Selenomonas sp. WCT3 TaxID=3158785 RepID=UPI00088BE2EF|nr:flagellar assembly factor FliW [Selenomonas ruminantium]